MKGLEKALDIIEAKIGKRKDFVVQDVLDYFDDEDIVEIFPVVEKKGDEIKEVPSLLELEHYGITGERTEEHGFLEFDYYPGDTFEGQKLSGHCLLIKQNYLRRKYGAEYEKYCEENSGLRHIYGFIDVQAIMVSTVNGEHITWYDTTAIYPPFEEATILKAMWIYKKRSSETDIYEMIIDTENYIEGELRQWRDRWEKRAIELFCNDNNQQ